MSKATATLGVGITGASLTAGGIYLSKSFNVDSELPLTLEKLDEEVGKGCISDIFSGIDNLKPDNLTAVGANEINFGEASKDKKPETQGCLVVNWDKWKKKEDNQEKWKGNFRFLWALSKDNKGFLVYATADTSNVSNNKKFKVKGLRLLLEKNNESKKWEIKKGKRVESDAKELEVSKLPKPGEKLSGISKDTQWNFAKNDAALANLCEADKCKELKESDELFRGYWIWKPSEKTDAETADKWTSNLTDWWKTIFDEDTNWNMTTALANIKGEWENKVIYWAPNPPQKEA